MSKVELYNGDCLEIMQKIENKSYLLTNKSVKIVNKHAKESEINYDLSRYLEDFSFGEEEFERTEQRLDQMNHLLLTFYPA